MNTKRRAELIDNYIDRVLGNMSTKDLMRIVGEQMHENMSNNLSQDEILMEIGEQYPELLDQNDTYESSFASYRLVKAKVTSIDLDFTIGDCGDELTESEKDAVIGKIVGTTFDLTIFPDDQVDEILVNTISNSFNWCVNSVQYEIVN